MNNNKLLYNRVCFFATQMKVIKNIKYDDSIINKIQEEEQHVNYDQIYKDLLDVLDDVEYTDEDLFGESEVILEKSVEPEPQYLE